jgi:hypothetical protein
MCLNLIIKDYENLSNYENKINYCFKPFINNVNNNKNFKRHFNFKEIQNDFISEISSFGFSPFINLSFFEQRNNKNIFKFFNENLEYGLLNFVKRRFKINKRNSFDSNLNRNNNNKMLKKSNSYFIRKKNIFNVNKENEYENNNYLFNIMKKISNEKKEKENKNNLSFNFKSIFSKNGKFLSNSNLNESNIFIKEFSNSFNKNLFKNNKNILNKNKILFKEKINEIFKEDQNKNENKNKKKKKIKLKFNRNLNKYLNSTKCSSGFLSKKEINNKNIENYDIFKVAIYQKKCDEYLNKFNK